MSFLFRCKQPGPPPPTASCYVCLENSTDSKPLLRNCACRGDTGWAHVACLAKFAASKVTEAQREKDPSIGKSCKFWEITEHCILCKTPYMQNMALAMAEAFVKQYEHLPDTNELRYLSLYYLASSRYNVDDTDGALKLYNGLLQTCGILAKTGVDVRMDEGNVHGSIAALFFKNNQFENALTSIERQRELCVAVCGPNSLEVQRVTDMKDTMMERIGYEEGERSHQKGDPAADLVLARQKFKEYWDDTPTTNPSKRFGLYLSLILALRKNKKWQECLEKCEELIAESRQIFGSDHPNTQKYENLTKHYRRLMVWAVIDCEQQSAINGQRVQVLRATKDARKYICLIKNRIGVSSKFKVTPNQFILETGTRVKVQGLASSTHTHPYLNGIIGIIRSFDKEKRLYTVSVSVETMKTFVVPIKPINLNIYFVDFETHQLKYLLC